ncbi:MAG: protocatechuate 4,5-dioxygenase subunit alpha [Gammaproteobacteria bacterium]|nr:protocatechuate 4,5-dioxygenase subunit alpha [Gammaproteobacteria bacterium]
MSSQQPYQDIPGTTVFDSSQARKGYHLNQFCMSLMKAQNRQAFKADEAGYLAHWPMSDEQRQAVLDRDYTRMIALGGNIYYLVKISATDGLSVAAAVSSMTDMSSEEYLQMMKNGGRPVTGNRYIQEKK